MIDAICAVYRLFVAKHDIGETICVLLPSSIRIA